MRLAVIGIGSNSVRLLVADAQGDRITSVLRDRRGTRLFASLKDGRLTPEGIQAVLGAVADMRAEAEKAQAERIFGFATSAVRDAKNGADFQRELWERAALPVEILSGAQEAHLSYWGAAKPGSCGMIDIGGGSTEITIGQDGEPLAAVSLQMGAVRLQNQVPVHGAEDVARAEDTAREILRQGWGPIVALPLPATWVGAGGTFTTLAAMDKQLYSFDRRLIEGHPLDYDCARDWARRVADLPLEDRYSLPGLQPQRADIVVHGIAILMACLRELKIGQILASDKGNLEGYLKYLLRTRPEELMAEGCPSGHAAGR